MKRLLFVLMVVALVTSVQANLLSNGDFESYTPVAPNVDDPGTIQVRGIDPGEFWDASGRFTTLDNWFSEAGSTWADSGTEAGGYNPTGTRNLYLMSNDGVAIQTTSYVIAAGDQIQVTGLSANIWDWAGLEVSILSDGVVIDTPQAIYAVGDTDLGWGVMSSFSMTFDASAGAGGLLGIRLANVGGTWDVDHFVPYNTNTSWLGVDNLSMDVVPEPATMALLGLGSLVALKRRK